VRFSAGDEQVDLDRVLATFAKLGKAPEVIE